MTCEKMFDVTHFLPETGQRSTAAVDCYVSIVSHQLSDFLCVLSWPNHFSPFSVSTCIQNNGKVVAKLSF